MLNCTRQNIHHSKLPAPGTIGHIVGLSTVNPKRPCIVSHYPLCDSSDYRYSFGIHTLWVRFLDNNQYMRIAWQWFQET